jgi:hypothetical protein
MSGNIKTSPFSNSLPSPPSQIVTFVYQPKLLINNFLKTNSLKEDELTLTVMSFLRVFKAVATSFGRSSSST